jgi:hypothetical protein
MEGLPDDVASKVLGCLTDLQLAHFAQTSRRCNDMFVRADLIRNISVMLWTDLKDRPRPKDISLPPGFKHCISCFMCKGIIPVPVDPGVLYHQCPHHTYNHPVWSDDAVMLYRGPIDHLPQPTLCSAKDLKYYHYRTPVSVFLKIV